MRIISLKIIESEGCQCSKLLQKKSQKRPAAAAEEAAAVAAAEARLMEREEEEENEISFHILCYHGKFLPPILRSVVTWLSASKSGITTVVTLVVMPDLEADPNQDIKVTQKLRSSQAHCVRSHHSRLAQIIRSLFSETVDELTNTVKSLCLMSIMERQSSLLTIL